MAIYKTRDFTRWLKKSGLGDNDLLKAVKEMERGLYDADLGGGVVKKRIARQGQGKSGGFRTLIATNRASKWFFMFGWPKNERSNINASEQAALKRLAAYLLAMSPKELSEARQAGEMIEVSHHE